MSFALGNTLAANARLWHLVDARGQVLGHLARGISATLTGELKPTYTPHQDIGDHVVVINARDIVTSGEKHRLKMYYSHSGYPGGMKAISLGELMKKSPEKVIEKAVSGMLPKNKLREGRMKRLHVFADDKHPYSNYIAKWLEYPEFESKINARMMYDMSAKEYLEWQDRMHRQQLEDMLKNYINK